MNYSEVVAYLNVYTNCENIAGTYRHHLGLHRMERLMAALHNPHTHFKSVHIAGTNGKGSTAAMIARILSESGYSVGLYTSPHLIDLRERIQCNHEMISRADFARMVGEIKTVLDEKKAERWVLGITYFEMITAVAFLWFRTQEIDCAVVEVGLGGRLDATTILSPLMSVITSIGLDHQHILGNTRTQIAYEKAGIIKEDSWVVSAAQTKEVRGVLSRVAREKKTRLLEYGRDFSVEPRILKRLSLRGTFQQENCALALEASVLLHRAYGFRIPPAAVERALHTVVWPGRCQVIQKNPLLIIDGAHNVPAAHALVRTLQHEWPSKKVIFVVGISGDKQYDDVIQILAHYADHIIVTASKNSRACSIDTLFSVAARVCTHCFKASSVSSGLQMATAVAQKEAAMIVVCGSLYLVGEVLKIFKKNHMREKKGCLRFH